MVVVVYEAPNGLRESFEQAGIPLVFFGITKRFGFGEGIKKLKTLIRKEKPSIVHATNFKSEIISRFAVPSFGIPLVGSIINDTYGKERYSLVSQREKVKLELYRALNRWTSHKMDKYISVAECIIQPNCKYLKIPAEKMVVVQNGRDLKKYLPAIPLEKTKINPDYLEGDILLVSNSRVVRHKGFEEMFGAFDILSERYPRLFLVVVGNGFDWEKYQERAKNMKNGGRIIFLGPRLDMPNILKACDIFWFPSYYEGSPGVVIEAMLCKIPIIGSNIPSILENIEDGENGIICEKGSIASLIEKTEYLIKNPELGKLLAEQAYQLGTEKFDIEKLTAKQEIVYLELIEKSKT
ncbi:glycosyltransferase family 4 protein [Aquiflexum sp. AIY15W]|nr:glycosyltransferase family 4 protein [Cognataquiflexum rubidum]